MWKATTVKYAKIAVFSAFYFHLAGVRFQEAEDDCTEALNLDDRYIKAYSRRATARKELGKAKEALEGIKISSQLNCTLIFYAFYPSDIFDFADCRC